MAVVGETTSSVSTPLPHGPSPTAGIASTLGSLAVVIGLILALAWLARRLQTLRGARGGLLQVTGGVAVGNKERVVIVQIAGEHFLVGVAPGQVSLLHRFEGAPGGVTLPAEADLRAAADRMAPAPGVGGPFADRLRELLGARRAA
nr:flagellar biosynthetic protein FliO [Solimonas marina]